MYCGTSAGGILALGLALRMMDLTSAKTFFTHTIRKVFENPNKLPFPSKHSPAVIEQQLKEMFGTDKFLSDLKPGDPVSADSNSKFPHVFLVSSSGNSKPMKPILLCNYKCEKSKYTSLTNIELWRASRATSAAPFYFVPIEIDGYVCMDGGLCANNPTLIALEEAEALWGLDNVSTVLSLGTGKSLQESVTHASLFLKNSVVDNIVGFVGFADVLASVATNSTFTDSVITSLIAKRSHFEYTRINPTITQLELDDVNPIKFDSLIQQAESYLLSEKVTNQLKRVAAELMLV